MNKTAMTQAKRFAPGLICLILASASLGCGYAEQEQLREELDENRRLWRERGSVNYAMTYDKSCFCNLPGAAYVVIEEGSIVKAFESSAQETPKVGVDGETMLRVGLRNSYSTVEETFDQIEAAVEKYDEVSVTYHPELGYPISAGFSGIENRTDSGLSIRISSLMLDSE